MYFDDLEVTLTEGKVIQSTDYYPFGLQQNTSWTRMDQTPNAHKFNAGTEYNEFSDTYDTPFRQYDPATGRFNGVDALAHMAPSLTPYRFGFNNPVSYNDPTGLIELPLVCKTCETNGGGGGGFGDYDDLIGSNDWLTGRMGPGSGRHWTDQLWGSLGAAGMERNARMMNQGTLDRFYSVTDYNRSELAESAAINYYGKVGSVEVGGYEANKYGWKEKPAQNGWSVSVGNTDQDQNENTARHAYDWGSSVSIAGNVTLGGGISFEYGLAWDNDGDSRWYFALGPSIGFDASIGILAKDYQAVNPKIGFDVTDLRGYGSAWNIAVGDVDGTHGGNLDKGEWNPWNYDATYYETGAGVSYGSPGGVTFESTYTWIW